jgi:hypothetical protein
MAAQIVTHLSPFTAHHVFDQMSCMDAIRPCCPARPCCSIVEAELSPHSSLLPLSALARPSFALELANAEHVHHCHGRPWSFTVLSLQTIAATSARTTASVSSPPHPVRTLAWAIGHQSAAAAAAAACRWRAWPARCEPPSAGLRPPMGARGPPCAPPPLHRR